MSFSRKIRPLFALTTLALLGAACGADPVVEESAPAEQSEVTAQAYLGTTYDQCSGQLKVLNSAGSLVTIQRGVWTTVYVSSYRFRWYCGSSAEATTCPVGTRYVKVYHSTQNREITWQCYY